MKRGMYQHEDVDAEKAFSELSYGLREPMSTNVSVDITYICHTRKRKEKLDTSYAKYLGLEYLGSEQRIRTMILDYMSALPRSKPCFVIYKCRS